MSQVKQQFFPRYNEAQTNNSTYGISGAQWLRLMWLTLAVLVIYLVGIEKNKGFDTAALMIGGGFVVYSFLPIAFRKFFLFLLAFAVEAALTGFLPACGILFIILVFVSVTYLSSKLLRNVISLLLTVVAILIVTNIIHSAYDRLLIMFAAIFLMLRYIFFLYELPFFKIKPVFIDRLCYIFMLPNACFPLFPIVDPKIYFSNYYSEPAARSMQQGLTWITRGILHTLIYRCIYLYLTPSPYEIEGFWKLLLFIFSGYSLILRLSGIFYISLGFLAIFGFSLPPIFDHYFFANSFPDLWRRINLYWRAFITRVFYYPVLFKLKKWPVKTAILITTMLMFVCTWLLHSWQWFWIKGSYTFSPNDILFWAFLGTVISINAIVLLNSLNRKPEEISESMTSHFVKGAKVIFMLMAMSFLWTLWTATSLTEFIYLLSFFKLASTKDVLVFLSAIAGLVLIAGYIRYLYDVKKYFQLVFKDFSLVGATGFLISVFLLYFILLQTPLKMEALNFISNTMNTKDRSAMERGYYEQLLNNDEKAIELFNIGNGVKKWNLDNKAYRYVNNILVKEFKPNYSTVFKGDSLYTNSMGLRDKEYPLVKGENVVRIALLGGSYEMGSGVSNEENFAALIEKDLNEGKANESVEIFNYGEGGYHLLQNVYVTQNKVRQIQPDYLFYFAHANEMSRCLDNMINVIEKKLPLSFDFLEKIYRNSGITAKMCRLEKYNRIRPEAASMVKWGYASICNQCKAWGIVPVLVYLPTNSSLRGDSEKELCMQLAKECGFEVLDLDGVYDGYDPESIQLSVWDTHPNQKGHQLIAKRLLNEMLTKKSTFGFLK